MTRQNERCDDAATKHLLWRQLVDKLRRRRPQERRLQTDKAKLMKKGEEKGGNGILTDDQRHRLEARRRTLVLPRLPP